MSGYATATSLVLTAVSTVASMAAASEQQAAQKRAQDYQAKVAQANANYEAAIAQKNQEMAEEQARAQRKEGYDAAQKKRLETAQLIGKQRAAQAGSGAQVDFGSNLDLNLDAQEKGEMDALAEYQKGLNAAYNTEIEAWNIGQKGDAYRAAASNISNQPTKTGSSLLAGIAAGASGVSTALGGLNKAFSNGWGIGSKQTVVGTFTNYNGGNGFKPTTFSAKLVGKA